VTHSIFGAIQDQTTSGGLNLNNLTVTVTDTAETSWGKGSVGSLLDFVNDAGTVLGGKFAPFVAYSNNAVKIDATASGGLISSWGDANFVGNQGDSILGAASPVGVTLGGIKVGDVLAGSPGNDIITSNSMTLPDYIVTNGDADEITLAAGHAGVDHVGFYDANGNAIGVGAYAVASVGHSITEAGPPSPATGFEATNPGWWGIAAGGSSTLIDDGQFGSLFPAAAPGAGFGTSASQSTVTNFNAGLGGDVLDFTAHAWGTGGLIIGLTQDTGAGLVNAGGAATTTGGPVVAVQVVPGGSIAGTGADLIVLPQGSFLNANALAQAFANGSYTVKHSTLGAAVEADFLVAYQGTDGNAHIADLHLAGGAGGTTSTATDLVTASDMVSLVGVSLAQLTSASNGGVGAHVHLIV
jgi:hypothetical protein